MGNHPIPIDDLRRLVRLDRETGALIWLERGSPRFDARFSGRPALADIGNHGYRYGTINRHKYLAHRVVFALVHGRWPDLQVDHIDRNRLNNRPDNLREASPRENQQNKTTSRSGRARGVVWHKRDKRWMAQCKDAYGRQRYLGLFSTEGEAAAARDAFAAEQHGAFAVLNDRGGQA